MCTEAQIEDEARALYEDYRAAKPQAVGGVVIPSWEDNPREDVREAWRACARGSLGRRGAGGEG
jgi:hypothetical protein